MSITDRRGPARNPRAKRYTRRSCISSESEEPAATKEETTTEDIAQQPDPPLSEKLQSLSVLPAPSSDHSPSAPLIPDPSQPPSKPKKPKKERQAPVPRPLSPPATHMPPRPLLIASLGNPGPQYAHTLHSAGHVLLSALRLHLSFPSFTKNHTLGKSLATSGADPDGATTWTLWQSPSYMNISGQQLQRAFAAWSKELHGQQGRLIVLHDELESPLGAVRIRPGGASARGHNGLKSVQGSLQKGVEWTRIGIGIGRPTSREPDDVARYVLEKMTGEQREKVEGAVGEVVGMLRGISEGEGRWV